MLFYIYKKKKRKERSKDYCYINKKANLKM
jgi:hypothetical protein